MAADRQSNFKHANVEIDLNFHP